MKNIEQLFFCRKQTYYDSQKNAEIAAFTNVANLFFLLIKKLLL